MSKKKLQCPQKKQWDEGVRPCLKCERLMKKGEYSTIPTPPEFIGQPYDWVHKREVICALGYFHCPGDKCTHKDKPNQLFFAHLDFAIRHGKKTIRLIECKKRKV